MGAIILLLALLFTSGSTESAQYKHYIAEGPSMTPTVYAEDRLTVDPGYYKEHPIERGDIIIFNASSGTIYVKRVIGLSGETVRVTDNKIYIDDIILDEPYIQDAINKAEQGGEKYNRDFPETKVPVESVFVMGDNRQNSMDSRMIGSIPSSKIIGKVIQIEHVLK